MNLRRIMGRFVTPPLVAGILALHLDGCAETVPQGPRTVDLRADADGRFYFIAPGSEIEITRRDGVLLRGRFLGTARMRADEYERRCIARADSAAIHSSGPPSPGDSIEICLHRGEPHAARLAGYSLAGLEVESDSDSIVTIGFTDLKEMRAGSWTRTGTALGWDVVGGRLPLSTLIRVGVADGEVTVAADQIAEVRVPTAPGSNGASGGEIVAGVLVATVLGAALALYIIGHAFDHAFDSCGTVSSSAWSPSIDELREDSERAGIALAASDSPLAEGGRP